MSEGGREGGRVSESIKFIVPVFVFCCVKQLTCLGNSSYEQVQYNIEVTR